MSEWRGSWWQQWVRYRRWPHFKWSSGWHRWRRGEVIRDNGEWRVWYCVRCDARLLVRPTEHLPLRRKGDTVVI